MNYTSIEDIFNSTNYTTIRNNNKNDDNVDTITAPSWVKYDGQSVDKIYVSGNSFICFNNNSTEHIKVNRRDGAMYYLRTEEGTYKDNKKFFKIRCEGYSRYSSTSSSYAIKYDIILWDDEIISLRMIKIPTNNNDGVYSITSSTGTTNYTVSTASPNVTFTRMDNGTYSVTNGIREFVLNKYLIRSGTTLYTIDENALSSINETAISASTFETYGVNKISNLALLKTLSNPEILFYTDKEPVIEEGLVINGTPTLPQILSYNAFDVSTVSAITKVQAVGSDDAMLLVSFDNGVTWYYYASDWVIATDETTGMPIEVMNNIPTAQWTSMATTTINFKAILPAVTSEISAIYIS